MWPCLLEWNDRNPFAQRPSVPVNNYPSEGVIVIKGFKKNLHLQPNCNCECAQLRSLTNYELIEHGAVQIL